jgi:hypothetical protein
LIPGQSTRRYCQRMFQVNHEIKPGPKHFGGCHLGCEKLSETDAITTQTGSFVERKTPRNQTLKGVGAVLRGRLFKNFLKKTGGFVNETIKSFLKILSLLRVIIFRYIIAIIIQILLKTVFKAPCIHQCDF